MHYPSPVCSRPCSPGHVKRSRKQKVSFACAPVTCVSRTVRLNYYGLFMQNPQLLLSPQKNDKDLYKDTRGAPAVTWRGSHSLKLMKTHENFDRLTIEEVNTCQTLRLLPTQYLSMYQLLLNI
jgi:hypothetical protein